MNIFNKIGAFFMSLFFKYNLETVTGIKSGVSSEMINKIDLWNLILQGRAPWNAEAAPSGIVNSTIGQLANAVSEELDVESENEKLNEVMKRLNENSKEIVQNIVALGGCIARPVYKNNKLQFEIIKLGNYIPTAYDLDGTLLGCVITKKIDEGDKEYLLLEKHNFNNNTHAVEMELYKIKGSTLTKTSLDTCSITAGLTPRYTWENVNAPFIVEFRNRAPNIVDGSNIPCALWQNTENLIESVDKQYNRINWEQEGGNMVVFADEDLFKKRQVRKGEKVNKTLSPTLEKLVVKISGNGTSEEKIQTHAPALRTQQQTEAFNEMLRRCELAWNIGKGTLSDMETAAQTATQYTGGKKALYTLVDTIESELEEKYKKLAYIFAYMLAAYKVAPFNDELVIKYNDTARKDPEAIRRAALEEVVQGIISKDEYRMRIFGEDEETAAARVPEENAASNMGGYFDLRG